jgi:hypothetical protein
LPIRILPVLSPIGKNHLPGIELRGIPEKPGDLLR